MTLVLKTTQQLPLKLRAFSQVALKQATEGNTALLFLTPEPIKQQQALLVLQVVPMRLLLRNGAQ